MRIFNKASGLWNYAIDLQGNNPDICDKIEREINKYDNSVIVYTDYNGNLIAVSVFDIEYLLTQFINKPLNKQKCKSIISSDNKDFYDNDAVYTNKQIYEHLIDIDASSGIIDETKQFLIDNNLFGI